MPHIGDAITALTNDVEWEAIGDDIADIVAACKESVEVWYSDMLIGQIAFFVSVPPSGWLELDGTTHAQADYPETAILLCHLPFDVHHVLNLPKIRLMHQA